MRFNLFFFYNLLFILNFISCNNNSELNLSFINTVKNNNIENIKILINQKVNLNYKDKLSNTPLHYAVYNNNDEIVDLLLKKGSNINIINKENLTPINIAIKVGYIKVIKIFLNNDININTMDGD